MRYTGRRRKVLGRVLLSVAAAMTGISCASPGSWPGRPAGIALGKEAAGSTVSLHRGQTLTVSLPGNPTTGYRWEVLPGAGAVLALQGEPGYTPSGSALGAGGVYHFIFTARTTGTGTLKFAYRRSFEAGVPPAERFEVIVVVAE